jgi:hypothetical protein
MAALVGSRGPRGEVTYWGTKCQQRATSHTFTFPNERRLVLFSCFPPTPPEESRMLTKFAAALAFMTLAGAASAATVVVAQTPEIDPASAMAGLTLLAGGLAVLRGSIAKKTAK